MIYHHDCASHRWEFIPLPTGGNKTSYFLRRNKQWKNTLKGTQLNASHLK